jgi:hypothetical protein
MPIFCFDINFVYDEILVPITCRISASIEPATEAVELKRVEESPENGLFWELEAEQSQQAASEDAQSSKIETSDVKEIKKGRPNHNKRESAFDVQRCIADWREAISLSHARIILSYLMEAGPGC